MPAAATKSTTLFSIANVKAYCKAAATGHDAALVQIADGVSERIDAYIRRPFVTRAIVETREGNNTQSLQLRHFPVTAVSSARIRYSMLQDWTALLNTEYELDGFRGYLHLFVLFWPKVRQGCEISYTAGFGAQDALTLPQDIVGASLDFVKFLYDRWKSDTVSLGSLNLQTAGSAVIVPALPKDITDALERYVKRRL